MVPILKDAKGLTLANRCDFLEHKNILINHNIPYETFLQWGKDCLCWGLNPSPLNELTYERQDQDWLLDLCCNLRRAELKVKIS